ncbi:MAG: PIN domain-containing protein [Acidobacteriota bacterium]
MRFAVDTNVLLDILLPDAAFTEASKGLLDHAKGAGALVMCPVVYAELYAAFGGDERGLVRFCQETGFTVEPIDEETGHAAGSAWLQYAGDKRKRRLWISARCECGRRVDVRKPLIADFLIGAHALVRADALVTRDMRGLYRNYFPSLRLLEGENNEV